RCDSSKRRLRGSSRATALSSSSARFKRCTFSSSTRYRISTSCVRTGAPWSAAATPPTRKQSTRWFLRTASRRPRSNMGLLVFQRLSPRCARLRHPHLGSPATAGRAHGGHGVHEVLERFQTLGRRETQRVANQAEVHALLVDSLFVSVPAHRAPESYLRAVPGSMKACPKVAAGTSSSRFQQPGAATSPHPRLATASP